MINRLKIGLFILIITYNLINPQTKTFAAPASCASKGVSLQSTSMPLNNVPRGTSTISFTFTGLPDNTHSYYINFEDKAKSPPSKPVNNQVTLTANDINTLDIGNHEGWLYSVDSTGNYSEFCSGINLVIVDACLITYNPNPAISNQSINLHVTKGPPGTYAIALDGHNLDPRVDVDASGQGNATIGPFDIGDIGVHTLDLVNIVAGVPLYGHFCKTTFIINNPTNPNPQPGGGGTGGPNPGITPSAGGGLPCTSPLGDAGVKTVIGCVPYDPQAFIKTILGWILGFASGIALLIMILGGFQMITSAGNPDAIKSGQERFTSAVIGLIFILLSVTILEILGVDILQIPGIKR